VQLQQVILNLLVNACDSMIENSPPDRRVVITTADVGSAVRLSISDRGTGISVDPLELVFEPFVTSKQHGLGLGSRSAGRSSIRTVADSGQKTMRAAEPRFISCCRGRSSPSTCRRSRVDRTVLRDSRIDE
jgi:hypothetical protein